MSGAPRVTIEELDLTTRVPSFPGVYGGIVVAARRGPVGVPTLVTSETQYLQKFTANESVGVGEDMAHFSALAFLQRSNKLWVIRPEVSALYAGVVVNLTTGTTTITGIGTGEEDPEAFTFAAGDLFLVTSKDPGAWGNSLQVATVASTVEPDSFQIDVYWNNVLVESHLVSRVVGQKDGYDKSMYIEDVVSSSRYISVVDNVAEADDDVPGPIAATALDGGTDGDAVVDADRVASIQMLQNTNALNVTLLLDGGNATAAYHNAMIAVAEARKDCIAILSVPYAAEAAADYLTDITTYRTTTLNANTSYAAMYSPHVLIYDKFNDRKIWVSPDGFVGAVISATASNFEIWYPPAGFRRGRLPTVEDVLVRYTDGEMDVLYDMQVNPIRFAPGRGILVWGQKTLLSRPSRLDRLNVRLLLIVIEPAIGESLEDYVFEFNDVANRSLVTNMINSYMDNIRGRNGVYDYYVVCSDENNSPEDIDSNRMNVWLFVKPTASAEYIRFRTIITPTGLDFSQALASA